MEKRKGIINPKTCCQVGLVARDIEKTAALYAEVFGVPMPEINSMPPVEVAQTKFRGIASGTQARLCGFDMGQLFLEIMERMNATAPGRRLWGIRRWCSITWALWSMIWRKLLHFSKTGAARSDTMENIRGASICFRSPWRSMESCSI